jgi:pimeloyl-ACP methyl ester carboxylesterase
MTDKTPLVLLPGLLCDTALWRDQIDDLSDIARITVGDLTRDDQLGPMARRVLDESPESFALAGLSMGGYVAMEIVRQAPDRIVRLALLDTSARADSHEQKAQRQALIDLAGGGEFKGVTRRLLPQLIHPDRLNESPLTETIFAMAERVGREAFQRQQRVIMNRPDSRRDLGLVHCPTLVLCGRQDVRTPLAVSEEMAEKIPSASLVVIEDCGHLAPLERPPAVSATFREWLSA